MDEISEDMCRLCLQISSDMENIFDSEQNYVQIVEELIGLKIKITPGFPRKICRDCLATIQLIYNFKIQCSKNDKKLQEFYQKKLVPLSSSSTSSVLQFEQIKILSVKELNEKTEIEFELDGSGQIDSVHNNDDDENFENHTGLKLSSNINEMQYPIDNFIETVSSEDEKPLSEIKDKLKNFIDLVDSEDDEEPLLNSRNKRQQKVKQKSPRKTIARNNKIRQKKVDKPIENKEKKKYYDKNLPCHLCGKFYRPDAMEGHLNMHNGLRPYACPIEDCDKAFTSGVLQRRHYRVCHTDYAPYVCDVCGHKCKNKPKLTLHRSYHFDPTLPCKVCGKLYKNTRALGKHLMVHTGERPFKCEVCEKCFQTRFTWRIHQRVHTKEKPYQCSKCDKSFAYNCLLKAHTEKYHIEKS